MGSKYALCGCRRKQYHHRRVWKLKFGQNENSISPRTRTSLWRIMQVISGVHFNYSLPTAFWPVYQALESESGNLQNFISDSYFSVTRNLQRFGWLIPYLFGASPAVCKSFLGATTSSLIEYDNTTLYEPYATSLRMGDIGYQNSKGDHFGVKASYDNIETYIACLTTAIDTPCPEYEKFNALIDGEYQQLNANITTTDTVAAAIN